MAKEPLPTILVIEDEKLLRNVVVSYLMMRKFKVLEAQNGKEGLEIFYRVKPDLVLTDLAMPVMDGYAVVEELALKFPDTPVVVMSGAGKLADAIRAVQLGCWDYIIKPIESIDALVISLKRMLERARLLLENRSLVEQLQVANQALTESNEVLSQLALRDGLTGLYNHRFFQESFAKELAKSKRLGINVSLLFIDVYYFKKFNDTHGHPMGDALLKELAEIFLVKFREADIVARYGGEEFVAILTNTAKDGAMLVAEQLRLKIENHSFAGRESIMPSGAVTISMGVATYPDDGDDASSLLTFADQALYRAKHNGRNMVC